MPMPRGNGGISAAARPAGEEGWGLVFAHAHAHIRACTHARSCTCTHARRHARTQTHTRTLTQTQTHARARARTRARKIARTHARTHARSHAHTHTHAACTQLARTHAHSRARVHARAAAAVSWRTHRRRLRRTAHAPSAPNCSEGEALQSRLFPEHIDVCQYPYLHARVSVYLVAPPDAGLPSIHAARTRLGPGREAADSCADAAQPRQWQM